MIRQPPAPGNIEVWRSTSVSTVELRAGTAVSAPYPRHWHEEYQFCLVKAGGGSLDYRGQRRQTPPATLFVVHPGEPHSNQAPSGGSCSFRSLYVAPEAFGAAPPPFFPSAVIDAPETLRVYERLFAALDSSSQLEAEGALLDFLAQMIERHGERPGRREAVRQPAVVARVREMIDARAHENLSLAELACEAQMSPFQFHRAFRQTVGMPPHAYQTQARVARAKRLLRAGRPVATVAFETGFSDQSHLTRHFRRLVLLPPGQYARGCKNVQD